MIEGDLKSNHNHSPHPRFTSRSLWICMTALICLLLWASGARADTQYCYTGSELFRGGIFSTNGNLTGCVIFSPSGSLLFFDFTGLGLDINSSSFYPPASHLEFGFTNGQITGWDILLFPASCFIGNPIPIDCSEITSNGTDFVFVDVFDAQISAYSHEQGYWTGNGIVNTPEPSSFALLLLGLMAVGTMRLRTR